MKYCSYCGHQLHEESEFCSGCGKQVLEAKQEPDNKRKTTYVGEVRKCPSCGAQIHSFTAVCSECGHEINSGHIDSSLKNFAEKLSEYDALISSDSIPVNKSNWDSWGFWKKTGWILINIYTLFIPLAISKANSRKKTIFSPSEQNKASFIDHYIFPNEREPILEALLFIKGQMSSLLSRKVNGDSAYWSGVWMGKANQLYAKAQIMLEGDRIANNTYDEISKLNEQIDRINAFQKIKPFLIIALVVVVSLVYTKLKG